LDEAEKSCFLTSHCGTSSDVLNTVVTLELPDKACSTEHDMSHCEYAEFVTLLGIVFVVIADSGKTKNWATTADVISIIRTTTSRWFEKKPDIVPVQYQRQPPKISSR
jgi:hypothetical protein